jgi:vacuolar protein sorting-associated protein 35
MVTAMRGFFGQGGPQRLSYTLPATFFAALALIPKIRALDARRAEGEDVPAPMVSVKKVFQFLHKTTTELQKVAPESAFQLWLIAAVSADSIDRVVQGAFEPICFEFLSQALVCFEEEVSETTKQYAAIYNFVGTLTKITCLEGENFDTVAQKLVQHAARLLKKPLQIRAVAACSHLFWCDARRDGKRVLECLQKCLKITDSAVTSDAKQIVLWVEMLDKYIYYYEVMVEEVNINFINSLLNLCEEHISYAEKDSQAEEEGKKAKAHLKETAKYLRSLKNNSNAEIASRFAELKLN